jgi:iron(III) transport system substrate-binding protein
MTRWKPGSLLAMTALAGLLAGLLTGCGSSDPNALTLYSGQHEQTTSALVAGFERATGIKVSVRSADEATLGNELLQEGGNSPADVFYSENSPVLETLREHGLLGRVDRATLAAIPARFSSPEGDWVGVSARASVLVYNTAAVRPSELPASVLELASPRWRGKLAFAPSETDFQPLITAIVRRDGVAAAERWLRGIQANARSYPDNEAVVSQVNDGQSALGPIDHYYWYRLHDELGKAGVHSALHNFAAGDPGALIDVSGAAIVRSSAHQAAAQRFLAFLVSARGQEIIAHSRSYEYPLRPGVAPAATLPALS